MRPRWSHVAWRFARRRGRDERTSYKGGSVSVAGPDPRGGRSQKPRLRSASRVPASRLQPTPGGICAPLWARPSAARRLQGRCRAGSKLLPLFPISDSKKPFDKGGIEAGTGFAAEA
jgi:hypothetical protein